MGPDPIFARGALGTGFRHGPFRDGFARWQFNNAGLVTAGLERTRQGWELQFATNHLVHFALALGLHPHLAAAAAARGSSRIVALSSTAHMRARSTSTTSTSNAAPYNPQIAYAQAKQRTACSR